MMEFPTAPWWFLLLVLACCMGIVWAFVWTFWRDEPDTDNLYPKDE